ncbi:extracellular solute-binding protein [Cohnella hashimotonis]|uniref:Extracellular solute-binding protein n=1 Tax=Cohnella hashimotonis TaxID=2826895 RepID=A0ABT6TJX9_9BACL|nr:extracellular solute-binding protein [Cohnella hashimotonis]MDI4647039.1 extracellular solute-binding protein [Cohnella hashimotonis]
MTKAKRTWIAALLVVALGTTAACSDGGGNKSEGQGEASASASQSPGQTGGDQSPDAQPEDIMAKYDPPIEISTGASVNPTVVWNPGESIDKNSVYDNYEQELGIRVKNKWAVDTSQYDAKVKITIASNDLPDFMYVQRADLDQLVKSDMVMDLTDLYEKYATPETKKFLTADGGAQLDSAKSDGKLMAIPRTDAPYVPAQILYIRNDWLKKLNLQAPKTMQDVLDISHAFATMDPDGNGKADTIGLSLQKEILASDSGLIGYFSSYHAYPGKWIKTASGQVEYGGIQPEVKTTLKRLQDMFKAGELDKEFMVKDSSKSAELLVSDKAGMVYGPFWMPSWPLQGGAVKDGKVVQDWGIYAVPSIDDKPALQPVDLGVTGYYVISKKAKHPEAVFKLLNRWVTALTRNDPTEDVAKYSQGSLKDKPQAYYTLNPVLVYNIGAQLYSGEMMPKAIKAKDPSMLNNENKINYENVMKFEAGDANQYGAYMAFKEGGSQPLLYEYFQEGRYLTNAYSGPPTATMADRWATLQAKEMEVFTKIITNGASVDEFDKYVEQWKTLGGAQITQEVNDWLQSH